MSLIPFRADLHCHSTYSDGSYTPEELVALAKELGLDGLALTDHDTFDGLKDLEAAASLVSLPVFSGAEFSSRWGDISLHILAYAFDPENQALKEHTESQKKKREERIEAIIQLLKKHGIFISREEIPKIGTTIGRPHLAEALVRRGFVSSRQEAFRIYLGEKGKCFVPAPSPTAEEIIDKIHQAKGVAIIAHPHLFPQKNKLENLFKLPFDGIEGSYAKMGFEQNSIYIKHGKKRDWIITGGSDFHGAIRPDLPLGSSWTDEEVFSNLLYLYKTNKKN